MKNPYYEMTVPLFVKALGQVDHLLESAQMYVAEKGIPESDILTLRLAPDMFAFTKQVQVVCDNAKGATARFVGVPVPAVADTETSLADLRARVAQTRTYIEGFTPEQFLGAGERIVELPYFKGKHFIGAEYLTHYALPNFFFHFSMVYALLRMKGLTIGKKDFVGVLPLRENVGA